MTLTPTEACLSVIVPCYDVVDSVVEVIELALASPYTAEVIAVDGGSTDGTIEALRGIHDKRLSVIEQGHNLGRGAGLRRGMLEATQPFVLVQDADDIQQSGAYARMLAPLLEGNADAVFGSRFTSGPHRVLPWTHTVASKVLTLLSDAVTDLNLTDVAVGLKAFRREVLAGLELEQDRFGFEFEVTAKAANAGWRIHEVAISSDGRGRRPPRVLRWSEGIRATYCIARYSRLGTRLATPRIHGAASTSFDDADESLAGTLDNLDDAGNYAAWIIDLIAPHVGGEIIELGAGHGTMSERLRRLGSVTASQLSPQSVARLRTRFADVPEVTVVVGDVVEAMAGGPYDSAVMVNVLEHIPDDVEAVQAIYDGLRPGGTLAVYVPAHEVLFSTFDRLIGHQRRYRRSTLTQVLSRAGFEVIDLRYVTLPGVVAWFVIAGLLGRTPSDTALIGAFDRVVIPLVRLVEDRWRMPTGTSLLAIARRPA